MKRFCAETNLIEETAADWFVRRRDGLAPEAEAKYQQWLAADSRHAAAMAELSETWALVNVPAAVGREKEAARRLDRRESSRRARPYVFAAVGLAAAAVLMFALRPENVADIPETSVGAVTLRPNIEKLPDGSTIELNAQTEITVDFTPTRRAVRLITGEAHFAIAKDPDRPFVVTAGGVAIRAVGTEFAVRLDTREVGVVVTEGKVAVDPRVDSSAALAPSTTAPVVLDAGKGVLIAIDSTAPAAMPVQPMPAGRVANALAWRERRVEFSNMSLAAAAAVFNQHNRVQLSIADEETAALPISGIFWSNDPEAFARLLASGFGVHTERVGDRIVLRRR